MAAGAHPGRRLRKLLQNMDDLTDVRMAREDPGLMTSIGSQVY